MSKRVQTHTVVKGIEARGAFRHHKRLSVEFFGNIGRMFSERSPQFRRSSENAAADPWPDIS